MPFQKGKSGNPNGRPPKNRAVASQIEKALNRTETGFDGKKHKRVGLLAEIFVNALLTGTVKLPNGTTLQLPPREWMEMGKFVVTHVDGPAKSLLELSGNPDAPLILKAFDYSTSVAALTPGPSQDSLAPGQDQNLLDGQKVRQNGHGG